MRALVVVESWFGNTAQIAYAISDGLCDLCGVSEPRLHDDECSHNVFLRLVLATSCLNVRCERDEYKNAAAGSRSDGGRPEETPDQRRRDRAAHARGSARARGVAGTHRQPRSLEPGERHRPCRRVARDGDEE